MTWNTTEASAQELTQELIDPRVLELNAPTPRGIWLTVGGFLVAVLGMVLYCTVCLGGETTEEFGMSFLRHGQGQVGISLGIIGLGVVMWFIGSFQQMSDLMLQGPAAGDEEE